MSEQSDFFKKHATSLATGFSLILLIYGVRHRAKIMEKLRYVWDFRNPLRHKRIEIVDTVDDCQRIVNALKLQTSSYKVVGFDCEWVTVGGSRRPVALLQLATHQGLCALFRLCHLQHIPKPLRELLEDESLLKVGVSPLDDAKKLCSDYGIGVASTFDLRFLAAMTGNKAEGLAKLSKSVLKVQLDKNWRLVCSDWESMVLSERQLHYAANDALVAVEIFHKLALNLEPRHFWELGKLDVESIKDRLESLYDVNFKGGYVQTLSDAQSNGGGKAKKSSSSSSLLSEAGQQQLQQKRNASTRSRTLYDNCLLRAPDDELLCTIDYRKAQWYIRLDLGEKTCDDPFTVRLKFEPAGRAKGDPGEYYQTPKENQCVVCGRRDSYNRKNIVPREYRKYFPTVMKNHTSHDILLLCPQCHQMSDLSNLQVRERLAQQCQAPFKYTAEENRFREDQTLKKVKSAARALAWNYDRIPKPKRDMLEDVVKQHLGVESLTMEQIEEATNLNDRIENENFCDHGYKVVQAYQNEFGGLVELEKLWRQHFLDSMHPKFMPALWNVNHNANRLEIRAKEGRVTSQELQYAGLNIPVEERKVPQRERIARCEEPVNVEN